MTSLLDHGDQQRCQYCQGALDLRYHFCVHCATVYREPDESVYGTEPDFQPRYFTRLNTEGQSAITLFFLTAIVLAGLGGITIVAGMENLATTLFLQWIAFGAITVVFAIKNRDEVRELFGPPRAHPAAWTCVPILAALLVVNWAINWFLIQELGSHEDDLVDLPFRKHLSTELQVLLICVFPGIFEELAFRGVIQTRFVAISGFWRGAALTSALFTILHVNPIGTPYLFVLSMFLCWVRERTGSLYLPVLLHFAHNWVVLFVFPMVDA